MNLLKQFLEHFGGLTDAEIQLILDHSDVREFKKGTILLQEGEIAQNCFLVLRGCVREYLYKDGEDKTVAFYTESDPVNAFTSATSSVPLRHNYMCMEDCTLTVSDQALEEKMCQLIPRLETIIRQEVEKHTGQAHDDLARFITTTPEERYVDLIEKRPDLLQRVPQHQIASYLGITPESLSRIRKRMMQREVAKS